MALSFTEREFIPVLLGGDINVYSMARAFFERYGVKSVGFGRYATGPAFKSLLIDYTPDPAIASEGGFDRLVNGFARAHADKTVVLVGCGDEYAALCARAKDAGALEPNIVTPYGPYRLMEQCQKKEIFYGLCERHGVPYPKTFTFTRAMLDEAAGDAGSTDGAAAGETPIHALDALEFPYPLICKPSDGIRYWQHPFDTQKKAYAIADRAELERTIRRIYAAGYDDGLILQDMVPGNDERMYVLTSYSDKTGKVRMMCLGHVLLEEHEPHAVGNHAAIITERNDELLDGARRLLEDLGHVGFSNFDVKYDERDGSFKFFDFNTRQGRSNYYVTASGLNTAEYIVEEYVHGKAFGDGVDLPRDEFLWHVVPMGIIDRYVKDPGLRGRTHALKAAGKSVNPLFMKGDFTLNRWLRMEKLMFSHYRLYKEYYR